MKQAESTALVRPFRKLARRLRRRWADFRPRFKKLKRRVKRYLRSARPMRGAAPGAGVLPPLPANALSNIEFATGSDPLVSVIIPVYGQLNFTLRCLASIAHRRPETTFEVIVVDDCSPDNSVIALRQIKGIKLISNDVNKGFIRSCNEGAKAAAGKFLCFLNNDTEVAQGWLDELVRTFREFPGAGLAGSKLLYPDGSLQEAGGIIWRDGSAWNFGRRADASLPIYNYAREVDYCSGASIMVPKALFDELGGFDELYVPAYGEDSDLALKLRNLGHRVIYQPLSVVVHHEGVTSGTDTKAGTKKYQIDNARKLFERWHAQLAHHQEPGVEPDRAKDRRAKYRALVLDHCTPAPNQDAGSLTVFNLLLLLRELEFQPTFIAEDNFLFVRRHTPELQRAGIEVLFAPHVTSIAQHLKSEGGRYDLVFVFRPLVMTRHLETIRRYCPRARILYHTVDLHFLRMSREATLLENSDLHRSADDMKQTELSAIRAADASIIHSAAEFDLLAKDLPTGNLHVFPLIMDVHGAQQPFAERRDIVFVGGYQHPPNIDAVRYFAEEIMPLLRRRLPKVRFFIVGSKPPAEVRDLACEDVIVTGFVEDLNFLLEQMRVSVAPLRYGAGIKGKIGTAMVAGLPTVATTLAVEGMQLTDDVNIVVADGPQAFAEAVARVYEDQALWNALSAGGLEFATRHWSAEAAWERLKAILLSLDFDVGERRHPLSLFTPYKGPSPRSQPADSL